MTLASFHIKHEVVSPITRLETSKTRLSKFLPLAQNSSAVVELLDIPSKSLRASENNQRQYQSRDQLLLAGIPHVLLLPQRTGQSGIALTRAVDVRERLTKTRWRGET